MQTIDAQKYINNQVQSGHDIVFAEDHAAIASTMGLMEETIKQNPNRIGGVSLEMPPEVNPYIDMAAAGEISPEAFAKQMRIATEQVYLDTAQNMLNDGLIDQPTFDQYEEFINGNIEAVMTGNTDIYTPEAQARDMNAFIPVYELAQTAAANGIQVRGTDINREYVVYNDLGIDIPEDWIERLDDTSDFGVFQEQFDVTSDKQFLVHRGASHTFDINGTSVGLDDHLENAGRSVTTVGNFAQIEHLQESVGQEFEAGNTLSEDTDVTIIGDQGYDQGAIAIYRQTPTLAP